jgi:anaerobic selenocysteine-containing dehydrogenase
MASRSQSKTTTDHDEIRQWAEARGGRPAVVKSTRGKGDDTGILRIDFPGYSGSGSLEEISWEEFFEKFDREKLALVYQETTARGQKSNFNKIVSRETVSERGARSRSGSRKSGGRGGSDTGRKRSGTAAKKTPREAAGAGKGSARKRSTAAKTSRRKSTGRKAAKSGSRSR